MPRTLSYADADTDTGTSRWQKAIGILGLAVVLWVGSEMYEVLYGDIGGGGADGGGHQEAPPAGGHG